MCGRGVADPKARERIVEEIRWFAVPVGVQLSNVGSEVHRAIKWKNKSDEQKKTVSVQNL